MSSGRGERKRAGLAIFRFMAPVGNVMEVVPTPKDAQHGGHLRGSSLLSSKGRNASRSPGSPTMDIDATVS